MKFKNFVKSLASSGVIYNRGVEEELVGIIFPISDEI